jgi:ABC-type transport system involved in multi-copper enzyme maturation permease subunit
VKLFERIGSRISLYRLAARIVAGRWYWAWPTLPLLWVAFWVVAVVADWRKADFVPADAQNFLIGTPLLLMGLGLGLRVIAGEIDQRTLEIAFTVPGGTHRVWLAKLGAALALLLAAEALLAIAVFLFCTSFPPGALYGALQAAVFYMVLGMGLAALTKSEATGGMLTAGLLLLNFLFQAANLRISPFWNPLNMPDADARELLAWTTQNRIGFLLAIAAVVVLAFGRAERREKMLGS